MRLLERNGDSEFIPTENFINDIPRYAILSHTWGADLEEVTFRDIQDGTGKCKIGYEKLKFCATQAARDDIQYFWVDTCCIDKSNSTEVAESINSMFDWYCKAARCYVYLSDVSNPPSNNLNKFYPTPWKLAFWRSRWFTRGWTLQELLAPQTVQFFDREGYLLGDKSSLEQEVYQITDIPLEALRGHRSLAEFSIDERFSWAKGRETTRHEDAAYCLFGIFDVVLPLLYGEGREKALSRLRREIQAQRTLPNLLAGGRTASSLATSRYQTSKSFVSSFNDAPVDLLSIHFIERDRELALIRDAHHSCEERAPARCAIWGIPGVGKTQIALRYTQVFAEEARASAVFWISCSNTEKLHLGFSQILSSVGHPDQFVQEHYARLVATRRWLEQPEMSGIFRWLLVLDNVSISSLEVLREYLPRQAQSGRILITTRTEAVARAASKASGRLHPSFEINPPLLEDAVTFFLKSVDVYENFFSSRDRSQVAGLVQDLGCLPFAIEHAASFVNQSYQTIDNFTTLYRGGQRSQIFNWRNLFTTYEAQSISSMFTSRLHDLRRTSPAASDLLNILVFWDPDSIEFETIKTGALALRSLSDPTDESLSPKQKECRKERSTSNSIGTPYLIPHLTAMNHVKDAINLNMEEGGPVSCVLDSLIELASSEVQLHGALQQLQMLSFIKRRSALEGGSYCMHDLTQSFIQAATESEGTYLQCFGSAVSVACGAFRQIEQPTLPESWHRYDRLISHILSLTKYSQSMERQDSDLVTARSSTAAYWHHRGRYYDARKMYQELLNLGTEVLHDAGIQTIQWKLGLADINWHLGNFSESTSLYEEVKQIQTLRLGVDHPNVLEIVENMALVYRSQARYAEARSMLERVIESRTRNLGPNHLDTVRAIDNLAHTISQYAEAYDGSMDEAVSLHKKALTIRETQLGSGHLDTLWSAENLARYYRAQGQFGEALEIYERVLKGRISQLGEDHPLVIYTQANIASAYSGLNRWEEAEILWRHLIVINEQQRGESHSQTLFAVEGLANVCLQQSHPEEAIALYERALRQSEDSLGDKHPTVLRRMHKVANLFRDQDEYIKSITLFEKLLDRRSANLRSGHPAMLQTFNDAATTYILMGKHVEAERCFRLEIAGSIAEFGSLHPKTITLELNLIKFLRHHGKVPEGEVLRSGGSDEISSTRQ